MHIKSGFFSTSIYSGGLKKNYTCGILFGFPILIPILPEILLIRRSGIEEDDEGEMGEML